MVVSFSSEIHGDTNLTCTICRLARAEMLDLIRLLYLKARCLAEMVNKFLVGMSIDLDNSLTFSECCHSTSLQLDITFVLW